MHEQVFIRQIIEEAQKQGDVEAVDLEIGELAHVPGDELVASFKEQVPWTISWTEIPAEVKCECGFVGHPTVLERGHDHFMIECPKCKSVPDLTKGTEIKLISVRVK